MIIIIIHYVDLCICDFRTTTSTPDAAAAAAAAAASDNPGDMVRTIIISVARSHCCCG